MTEEISIPDTHWHDEVSQLLMQLDCSHMPPHLQEVSLPFLSLGHEMANRFDYDGYELVVGLRKLVESERCMVRQAFINHWRDKKS